MCQLQWLRDLRSISIGSMFIWACGGRNVYFKVYAAGFCYCWPNLWQNFICQHLAKQGIRDKDRIFSVVWSESLLSASRGQHVKSYFEFDFSVPGPGEYCANKPLLSLRGLSVLHHFAATLFADLAVTLMDSGRCPARSPLLKPASSGAFCGVGEDDLLLV